MANLTTLAAVKLQLNITGTLSDILITDYVEQASGAIERETQRIFNAMPGTLTFDNCEPYVYGRRLYLHTDVIGIYTVFDGEGTLTDGEYVLKPYNVNAKQQIELRSRRWANGVYGAQQAITVAGSLGYSATPPADVELAATKLAAFLYQTRDNVERSVRFADGTTEIPADAPSIVLKVITQYRRVQIYG